MLTGKTSGEAVNHLRSKVAVVILNWNGWRDTIECVASLQRLTVSPTEIVVVDNASSDQSADRIHNAFPEVTLIRSERNRGFAGGNNLGITHALAGHVDYVWLLNNDTVVRSDALARLVELADSRPECAFFGSWISFYSDPEHLWFGGGRYRWLSGYVAHALFNSQVSSCPASGGSQPTDWVSGCSLLVRAHFIRTIGLLDPSLYLYREELDWQLRCNPRAPRAWIVCEPLVLHKVGRSTGTSGSYLGTLFMARNYLKLAMRYGSVAVPVWFARWLTMYVLRPIVRGDRRALRAAWNALYLLRCAGEDVVAHAREVG